MATKIETISLHFDPDVFETKTCLLCSGATRPAWLDYQLEDKESGIIVRNAEPIPGDICTVCEAEGYDVFPIGLALDKATAAMLPPESRVRKALLRRIMLNEEDLAKS
jgi:hypothetical protein